ncbi:LysR family transcriptional regulator [Actinotalea sp. M2MS4P-6]|uniref:LysR family transcriptional regulator n=1 Tax=Actinotalea sp. M2MS4P-6 TaxID=2983762 RepID=UPI0021E4A5FB|nr:LysR family transcriptional regulator [Actinotalea sp. M2MS4P-6]MCV2395117.1 LysR family transcriptional regulator [Actinotalea sp. M2MS4P-6]
MDVQSLKYFQYVAMYRNFSKAAEHFYIGQPALSRQIASLERKFGVRLFDRNTHRVSLTDAGQVLYANVELLLQHFERVTAEMEAAQQGLEGTLSIATVREFRGLFTRDVRGFMDAFPNVRTEVDDVPFDALYDSILNGVYDAALTVDYAAPENDLLAAVPVGSDDFVAIYARESDIELGESAGAAEVLAQPLVIPGHVAPPFLGRLKLAARDDRGAAGGITLVPTLGTALMRAQLGLGVTFVSRRLYESLAMDREFRCCTLSDLDTSCELVLIFRVDNEAATVHNLAEYVRTRPAGPGATR